MCNNPKLDPAKMNAYTNLRNMTANNPNLDLVSINSHIKFGEIRSICSQDIERK